LEYTKALKTVIRAASKNEGEIEIDKESDAYIGKLAIDIKILFNIGKITFVASRTTHKDSLAVHSLLITKRNNMMTWFESKLLIEGLVL
jgi:hypothetical protein